jgi:hypothetical protein
MNGAPDVSVVFMYGPPATQIWAGLDVGHPPHNDSTNGKGKRSRSARMPTLGAKNAPKMGRPSFQSGLDLGHPPVQIEQCFTTITEDMYMRRRVVVRIHHDSIAGESQDGRRRKRIAYS